VAATSYFLLLGSNQGNRVEQLRSAATKIEKQIGLIEKPSSIYQTAAWGKTDQPDFLNQVLLVKSPLSPLQTLEAIHAIELEMGRKRISKWSERIIDIDILYADDMAVDLPNLKIPHPEIQNRKFALVPLVEIASAFFHPVLMKTNSELLKKCKDSLDVQPFIEG
jgi:2-amino-4-hydroxy-6-hydroxymethyldihydropteridine diphosphokinase